MDSEDLKEKIAEILPVKKKTHRLRNALITVGAVFVFCLMVIGSAFAYRQVYKNKIYPGVFVGSYPLGGMTADEAKEFIENFNNRIAKEGLDFTYISTSSADSDLRQNTVSADDSSVDLVRIDSEKVVALAMSQGRPQSLWRGLYEPVYIRFFSPSVISADVSIEKQFGDNLSGSMLALSDKPHDANVKISSVLPPVKYEIIPEKSGSLFDYGQAITDVSKNLSQLSLAPVVLQKNDFMPEVFSADITPIISKLDTIIGYGDLSLNYVDSQTKVMKVWNIPAETYADWVEVRKADNGDFIFGLNKEKVEFYLETVRAYTDTPAKNAKFVMENDKVQEFQASQSGVSLNSDKTYSDLDSVFTDRNYRPADLAKTVSVSVDLVNPDVEVSSVNNLGITDIIGSGYSTFHDSHTNRIKNIANAVKRLNGVLIKPGEEFSSIKYAGPFTAENGFLPESVIKGDQLTNEIGGGMCQIGTTLFRMAMNSGMPITERRNHSLVVGYYADPVNGNPGTDATLYEPDVDFRFLNDTGNYLLLQTDIDYNKQMLTFTLWGKSDGRKGWYTHPIVSRWIPAGDPKTVVVTDGSLKPGAQKCQAAFRGAVASFTYSRITSSSEKIDRVFDSYYRPLPKICMVGATSTPPEPGVPVVPADASSTSASE